MMHEWIIGCQISLSNFTKCDTVLYCKTHYFKRFHEEGSYLGGNKFENKNPRDVKGGTGSASLSSTPSFVPPVSSAHAPSTSPPSPPKPSSVKTTDVSASVAGCVTSTKCAVCTNTVYPMDKQIKLDGVTYHQPCAKCTDCGMFL
jgi:hypothetical protein